MCEEIVGVVVEHTLRHHPARDHIKKPKVSSHEATRRPEQLELRSVARLNDQTERGEEFGDDGIAWKNRGHTMQVGNERNRNRTAESRCATGPLRELFQLEACHKTHNPLTGVKFQPCND